MRVSTPSTSSQCKGLLSRAALVSMVCAMQAMQSQCRPIQSAEIQSIPSVAAQQHDDINEAVNNIAEIDFANENQSIDGAESFQAPDSPASIDTAQDDYTKNAWGVGLMNGIANFFGSATDTVAYAGKKTWGGVRKLGTITVDAGQGVVGGTIGAASTIHAAHTETLQDLQQAKIKEAQLEQQRRAQLQQQQQQYLYYQQQQQPQYVGMARWDVQNAKETEEHELLHRLEQDQAQAQFQPASDAREDANLDQQQQQSIDPQASTEPATPESTDTEESQLAESSRDRQIEPVPQRVEPESTSVLAPFESDQASTDSADSSDMLITMPFKAYGAYRRHHKAHDKKSKKSKLHHKSKTHKRWL